MDGLAYRLALPRDLEVDGLYVFVHGTVTPPPSSSAPVLLAPAAERAAHAAATPDSLFPTAMSGCRGRRAPRPAAPPASLAVDLDLQKGDTPVNLGIQSDIDGMPSGQWLAQVRGHKFPHKFYQWVQFLGAASLEAGTPYHVVVLQSTGWGIGASLSIRFQEMDHPAYPRDEFQDQSGAVQRYMLGSWHPSPGIVPGFVLRDTMGPPTGQPWGVGLWLPLHSASLSTDDTAHLDGMLLSQVVPGPAQAMTVAAVRVWVKRAGSPGPLLVHVYTDALPHPVAQGSLTMEGPFGQAGQHTIALEPVVVLLPEETHRLVFSVEAPRGEANTYQLLAASVSSGEAVVQDATWAGRTGFLSVSTDAGATWDQRLESDIFFALVEQPLDPSEPWAMDLGPIAVAAPSVSPIAFPAVLRSGPSVLARSFPLAGTEQGNPALTIEEAPGVGPVLFPAVQRTGPSVMALSLPLVGPRAVPVVRRQGHQLPAALAVSPLSPYHAPPADTAAPHVMVTSFPAGGFHTGPAIATLAMPSAGLAPLLPQAPSSLAAPPALDSPEVALIVLPLVGAFGPVTASSLSPVAGMQPPLSFATSPASNTDSMPSSSPFTCSNALQDLGETGVDCGGTCLPCAAAPLPGVEDTIFRRNFLALMPGTSDDTLGHLSDLITGQDGVVTNQGYRFEYLLDPGFSAACTGTVCKMMATKYDTCRADSGTLCMLTGSGLVGTGPDASQAPSPEMLSTSCDDLLQNGDEEGLDCGGSCPIRCRTQVKTPLLSPKMPFLPTPVLSNNPSPAWTPIRTRLATPLTTPCLTRQSSPIYTQAWTPYNTPHNTVYTPWASPGPTSVSTPMHSDAQTPQATPKPSRITPYPTPALSFVLTPVPTPVLTPVLSPRLTNRPTP
eukprot:gene1444-2787_t